MKAAEKEFLADVKEGWAVGIYKAVRKITKEEGLDAGKAKLQTYSTKKLSY